MIGGMAKLKPVFVCTNCGHEEPRWFGRCVKCQEWETAVERMPESAPAGKTHVAQRKAPAADLVAIEDVELSDESARISSGIAEFDRVLGGGFVPGFYGLLAGDPGAGKSTLTNQAVVSLRRQGKNVAIFSGEESAKQIKIRLARLTDGDVPDGIMISSETSAERIYQALEGGSYDLAVIDSVNTVFSEEQSGEPGGQQQMRAAASIFREAAKQSGTPIILVGQVTKDSNVAGPRMLEHTVDAFLMFEGDRREQYRILRAMKNRFGSTDEIGVFEMTNHGLEVVEDPSSLFITGRDFPAPGAVITAIIEGTRPVLCEVQSLVTPSSLPVPIRASRGLDPRRVQLLLAVLGRRAKFPAKIYQNDVFLNIAGGLKVDEPAVDLAICAAVASSATGRPVKSGLCVFGEVTLLGEVRKASQSERRQKEAERQGLKAPIYEGTLRDVLEDILAPDAVEDVSDLAAARGRQPQAAAAFLDSEEE
jgi:DNA repair protein RadA/Sms